MNAYGQNFGGDWTDEKLERVRKYLVAYATIMNKNTSYSATLMPSRALVIGL